MIDRLSWIHTLSISVAAGPSPAVSKKLGAWKPFFDVLKNALRRTCEKWKIAYANRPESFLPLLNPTTPGDPP
ncbi:MAG TPA: hypothetical protein VGJ72_07705, partial [Polaromonas sp.]